MDEKKEKELLEIAKKNIQDGSSCEEFIRDIGWSKWMNEFMANPNEEDLTESDCREIDDYLKKIWAEAEEEVKEEKEAKNMEKKYKDYIIYTEYDPEFDKYYCIIESEDEEIYDGEGCMMCDTPEEAIEEGIAFVDEMMEE